MITASSTQNAFQEMADGATAAADATPGVKLTEAAPNGINGPQEVQLFQSATQTSRDGVATMTTTPDLFVRPFSTAVGQGIPVVAVDAPGLPGSKVTTFVGNSNTALGESLGKKMLQKIPANATGEVVFGNDIPGLPLLQARIDGMKKVIQAQRPNLKIVGPFNVGAEPTDNYNHWNSVVKAHPNAVAYLAPGDQDAVSMDRIEKQTGKHYLVGACDVDPIALQAVKNGNVYALGDPWHFLKGYMAISFLAAKAQKGTALPDGWFNPGSGIVDAQNVDQVMNREKSNANRVAFFKSTIDKELANPSAYLKPLSQAN
ncbi:MAG TPA: substrate-binding domain-containing protein [Thermoleophilaceae bacterium]|jgi:ribose transport system substrate-binding protein